MIKVLLVCNAGASTSIVAKKMKDQFKRIGKEAEVWAVPVDQAQTEHQKADIILLGPQVRYQLDNIKEMVNNQIPVKVFNQQDYATANAESIVNKLITLFGIEK
ncbi:PTS system cellobiose-specific IIB component [Scopulibacillus darangshiensis]|uniref:PTS system cellobiose-specific IIB component n=1 Tax=Scopulibacillus darangshiensis TaxID=442528 RepID=A0A4R2P9H7_9BACL|nr:PTS sugar transporter subunit IIB [Scopulibacillus darangshiensis]TCP30988.1 PTS system cellobiose-specific IIB component [Scopulibacillus darangshiensis]